jgi:DNA-binding response OmpR family regulator
MARILLIDDDLGGLEIRQMVLQRDGHQVAIADTADHARAVFLEFGPEAVVVDLRMPDAATGLGLIREFRRRSPNLRIVVLAGRPSDIEGREEHGFADHVLTKPTRSEHLKDAITSDASVQS